MEIGPYLMSETDFLEADRLDREDRVVKNQKVW